MRMTQAIDLNAMTTNEEIIQEYTDTILDLFIWAKGEAAVTEMSITVRDNNPEKSTESSLTRFFDYIGLNPWNSKVHNLTVIP